jgi:trans-aconitate 2-methyltransferase
VSAPGEPGRGTRDWDASTYDRVALPHLDWARPVIDRLGLRGDETVLDAGCGSGRVTELLVERLPRGGVIAVDGSRSMLAEASKRLGGDVTLIHADLLDLALDRPVDAIFSSAVFHWIADHGSLFERLRAALRPGGGLEAQCGGRGNIAAFREALERAVERTGTVELLAGVPPNNFAGPEETAARLERAGFERVECWLHEAPARPEDPRDFVRSICLGAHLEALPEGRRGELVDAVMEELGPEPELGYVRLNMSAVAGPAAG